MRRKSGMTGTALTEEKEFREIYGMDVIEIPTNLPVQRKDLEDAVYKTQKEKFRAVCGCDRRSTCKRISRYWSVRSQSIIPNC